MATREDFMALAEELGIEVRFIKPPREGAPLMMGGQLRDGGMPIWVTTSTAGVIPATKDHSARLDESKEGLERYYASARPSGCYSEFVARSEFDRRMCWLLDA